MTNNTIPAAESDADTLARWAALDAAYAQAEAEWAAERRFAPTAYQKADFIYSARCLTRVAEILGAI